MIVIKQDNFDLNKLKIKEVEGAKFKKMPFVYEGIPPVIEIEGFFLCMRIGSMVGNHIQ